MMGHIVGLALWLIWGAVIVWAFTRATINILRWGLGPRPTTTDEAIDQAIALTKTPAAGQNPPHGNPENSHGH